MPKINTIGIIGEDDTAHFAMVLSALANSCGLNLRLVQSNDISNLAGFIILSTEARNTWDHLLEGRPYIRIIQSSAAEVSANVRFGFSHCSPFPFKGRAVVTNVTMPTVSKDVSGEVIAVANGKPLWLTSLNKGCRQDTFWVSHPWIQSGDCVFHHLNGSRFLNLLPLLEWMRSISDWYKWIHPPLRACFIFDDPNIHSTRYGFLNFSHLAAAGAREHYHTAFATVPLDAYYVNNAAARIFRNNSKTLSLLIHGNNHSLRELAGIDAPAEQLALMLQSINRIRRLEQKTGISISKIMVPPHGVCSAAAMTAMIDAGFEAACLSHGSVLAGNPGAEWIFSLGVLPATQILGLPVIPRFGLRSKPENNILLAAYLNQPIIPIGHHWDLSDGTDALSRCASFINSLGDVVWTDMSSIARSNFRFRLEGQVMHVQPYSRITILKVNEGVHQIDFDASWLDPLQESIECWSPGNSVQPGLHTTSLNTMRFRVIPGTSIIFTAIRSPKQYGKLQLFPINSLKPLARRVLSEARDRSMPYYPRCLLRSYMLNR